MVVLGGKDLLNIGMFLIVPLILSIVETFVRGGGDNWFKIFIIFLFNLIFINVCTFAILYAGGTKELNSGQITWFYRLKYMGFGLAIGVVPLVGRILCKYRMHQFDISSTNRVRSNNFELLRIIAMGMIVLFHYAYGNGKLDYSSMGNYKVIIDVIWMFGELGVNLFALISGYFMIVQEKTFNYRKICLMWLQVLFYSTLETILASKAGVLEINRTIVLQTAFPVTYVVWWYATAYFVLYFIAPFLNKGLRGLEKQEYRRLIGGLLLIFSVWPTIMGVFDNNTETFFLYNRFIWIVIVYCIAGYIRIYGVCREKWTLRHWVCIHVFMWIITLVFIVIMPENGFSNNLKIKNTYFWSPNSIIMVVLSVTLFMIFSYIKIKENRLLSYIASCTFGIYLGHSGYSGMIRNAIFYKDLVGAKAVFVDMICAFICTAIVTLAIESLRKQVEKIILKLYDSIRLHTCF